MHKYRLLKHIGLTVCMCLITYGFIEGASLLFYQHINKKPFSFTEVDAQRSETLKQIEPTIYDKESRHGPPDTALHPYTGFVLQYAPPEQTSSDSRPIDDPSRVKPHGYRGEEDPFDTTLDPTKAIVAITGGSVADNLFKDSPLNRKILHSYLDKLPLFHGKKVVIVMLGRHSYQQPQQLFAVNYYLLQGGRLDLLINLDGYNERNCGPWQKSMGIDPSFPLGWAGVTSGLSNEKIKAAAEVFILRKLRQEAANISEYFSRSITISTLWTAIDEYLLQSSFRAEQGMRISKDLLPYYISGPKRWEKKTDEEIIRFRVAFWEEASLQLQQLANMYRFTYFHFLQPNQYMENSKILSEEEKAKFYVTTFPRYVKEHFPLFKDGIKRLHDKGVHAYSLTDIYKDVQETIYKDSCCHVNSKGNVILAHAIGRQISQTLSQNQKAYKAPR